MSSRLEILLEELVVALRSLVDKTPTGAKRLGVPRAEAAREMGISVSKLRELVASGEVSTCAGSPRLIPRSEIDRWTAPAEKTQEQEAPTAVSLSHRARAIKAEAEQMRALARKKKR